LFKYGIYSWLLVMGFRSEGGFRFQRCVRRKSLGGGAASERKKALELTAGPWECPPDLFLPSPGRVQR
jgi:hypothetical protein